jgi:RHS repeat-associated protein
MIDRKIGVVFVVIAVCVFFVASASGQSLPANPDFVDPASAYHTGDVDYVDVQTRRLSFNIPLLADTSQRGNLNFTYSLRYAGNNYWFLGQIPGTPPQPAYFLEQRKPLFSMDGKLDSFVDSVDFEDCNSQEICWSNELQFVDNDTGQKHTVAGNQLRAIDGSGIWAVSSGTVINREGVRFQYSGTPGIFYITDPNGNRLTLNNNTNTVTDTVGRSWTWTYGSTNTAGCPVNAVDASIWQVPGVSSGTRQFKLCYSNLPTNRPTGTWYNNVRQLTGVVLPDQSFWRFDYDQYGNLNKIYQPTGGTITYTYEMTQGSSSYGFKITTRTVFDGTTSRTWTYSFSSSGGQFFIVTDPLNQQTKHFIGTGGCGAKPHDFHQYSASGTLLKTTTHTCIETLDDTLAYHGGSGSPLVATTTTAWPNGQVSKIERTYDSGFNDTHHYFRCCTVPDNDPFHALYGVVISERTYDFGSGAPGPLLAQTNTSYIAFSNSNYLNSNLLALPSSQTVLNGSGNKCAETTYGYDDPARLVSSGVTMQHVAAPSSVRGNVTSSTQKLFTNPCQSANPSATNITSYQNVYDTGNVRHSIDARGNTTTFEYANQNPNWYGSRLTKITNALGHTTNYQYDWPSGLLAYAQDPNGHWTHFVYDNMFRPTVVNYPDGGQESASYTTTSTTITKKINSTTNAVTATIFDALGRPKQTQLTSDPAGTVFTETTYDGAGRVATVTNPHRAGSNPTDGTTTYQYDALGRVTKLIPPDGTTSSNNVTTEYAGNVTTVTDQAGKQRRSYTDGLGRLVRVDEPSVGAGSTPGSGTATVNGAVQYLPNSGTPGTGNVVISGSLEGGEVWDDCAYEDEHGDCEGDWVWEDDSGSVKITVNGLQKSRTFGSAAYDTSSEIAVGLRNAINADANYPVTATVSGSTIYLTAKQLGTATNYSLSTSVTQDYGSFTATRSGPTLTGGTNPGSPVYDAGTVWVTVNGFQAQTTYGQGSTASSVASAIANIFNTDGASPVTASLSGSTITVTARATGSATNYSFAKGSSTNLPGSFAQPSFTVSLSGTTLQGGSGGGSGLSVPYITNYFYDALGNLTCVEQRGDAAATGCANSESSDATSAWRIRRFTYDSLSRLLSAKNPESGATTYTYDANGNLLTKTDARGVITNYSPTESPIDDLNRVTKKTYSDGTPSASFAYDSCVGGCPSGFTASNPVGRLVKAFTPNTQAFYSYDVMGRNTALWQCTPLNCGGTFMAFTYGYNLSGGQTSLSYNGAFTISQAYNGAGQITQLTNSASDANNPSPLVTVLQFTPDGSAKQLAFGNGLEETRAYNNRQQVTQMRVYKSSPAADVLNQQFTWANAQSQNNGNLMGFSAAGSGTPTVSRTYAYDDLNRLKTLSSPADPSNCTGLSWNYDAWGNRTAQNVTSGSCGAPQTPVYISNRLTGAGFQYDAAGNLINDGNHNYTYDAENRIKLVDNGTTATYLYDANGQRVQKTTGSNQVHYFYEQDGNVLVEKNGSGGVVKEYVHMGGSPVAERSSGQTSFIHTDHLGSTRTVTRYDGAVITCMDYLPFGEQICGSSATTHKFTGKERDGESGLDNFGARYNNSSIGRFMSPDPLGGKRVDPQTLNLYSYVINNPLNLIDPTGMYVCEATREDDEARCRAFEQARLRNLESKNALIRRAAGAYGDRGDDNGVTVKFARRLEGGKDAVTEHDLQEDPNNPGNYRAVETVTLKDNLRGNALAFALTHEGSHVADAQDFARTLDPIRNESKYGTEVRGYMVTHFSLAERNTRGTYSGATLGAGVSSIQAFERINRMLANPRSGYGGVSVSNPGPVLYPIMSTPR